AASPILLHKPDAPAKGPQSFAASPGWCGTITHTGLEPERQIGESLNRVRPGARYRFTDGNTQIGITPHQQMNAGGKLDLVGCTHRRIVDSPVIQWRGDVYLQ